MNSLKTFEDLKERGSCQRNCLRADVSYFLCDVCTQATSEIKR